MISGRDATVIAVGALLVQVPAARLASFLVLGSANPGLADPATSPASILFCVLLVPSLAGVAWVWFFGVWGERDGWHRIAMRWPTRATVIRSLIGGLVAVLLVNIVVQLTPASLGEPKGPPIPFNLQTDGSVFVFKLVYLLGAVIAAPIFEEMVFRGVLFGWMRQRFAFLGSAVIAALPHAAVHGDPAALPALTAAFILFAWLREREGTLAAPIIAHGAHNAIVLMMNA